MQVDEDEEMGGNGKFQMDDDSDDDLFKPVSVKATEHEVDEEDAVCHDGWTVDSEPCTELDLFGQEDVVKLSVDLRDWSQADVASP